MKKTKKLEPHINSIEPITVPTPEQIKLLYDAYLALKVEYYDGFTFTTAARGYNLKSWNAFHKTIRGIKCTSYTVITPEEYTLLQFGPPEKTKKLKKK